MENLSNFLDLARQSAKTNPSVLGKPGEQVCRRYLSGLIEEVQEVDSEIQENNKVYLNDELSDIAQLLVDQ